MKEVTMNRFESLPDDIIYKIWNEVHKIYLKDLHIEIKYGWPFCRRMIYKNSIYRVFLNSEMSNKILIVFNEYLDYKKGKIPIPKNNLYIDMDIFIF